MPLGLWYREYQLGFGVWQAMQGSTVRLTVTLTPPERVEVDPCETLVRGDPQGRLLVQIAVLAFEPLNGCPLWRGLVQCANASSDDSVQGDLEECLRTNQPVPLPEVDVVEAAPHEDVEWAATIALAEPAKVIVASHCLAAQCGPCPSGRLARAHGGRDIGIGHSGEGARRSPDLARTTVHGLPGNLPATMAVSGRSNYEDRDARTPSWPEALGFHSEVGYIGADHSPAS